MVYELPYPSEIVRDFIKRYRLSYYFDLWWDDYIQSPGEFITEEQYKAVSAIRSCRTEALGVDHYVCDSCGEITKVYHSCKNRFCPTCSWKDTLDWAKRIEKQMLDIPHRHVVFTLPHQLNGLIKANKGLLLDTLYKTTAATIKDWMGYKYKLTPGIISVLHTFGEKKDFHPHIHMILSWGGITHSHELESIKGDYVNYEFLQTKFRCKFEDKLIEFFDHHVLTHHFKNRIEFLRFVKKINAKQWRIHFEPSMAIPSEVIRYIGRYSKRACLSEYKITNIESELITFQYKDYKNLDYNGKPIVKELTLHYREFFPRLLQHVPLPYFRLVRYHGAYNGRTKSKLAGQNCFSTPVLESSEEDYEMTNPKLCSNCKVEKTYLYTIFKNKAGERIIMSRFNPKKSKDKPNEAAA